MPDEKPKQPLPPGTIEFELTDFDTARRALDELPAGLAQVHSLQAGAAGYEAQRRKPLPSDRALTGAALDWMVALPPSLRPRATSELFPRVVNAVAASWQDLPFSLQVIDHMINDYRGGRRGFPASVQEELNVLYAHQRAKAR